MTETLVETITRLAHKTITFVVPEDYEWVDRNFETASWWEKFVVHAGTYPVRLTNINGSTWNPDPEVITPGYTANIGPYYAQVDMRATKVESYFVARLFTASSIDHKTGLSIPAKVHSRLYAHELRPLVCFGGHKGVIHITEE